MSKQEQRVLHELLKQDIVNIIESESARLNFYVSTELARTAAAAVQAKEGKCQR